MQICSTHAYSANLLFASIYYKYDHGWMWDVSVVQYWCFMRIDLFVFNVWYLVFQLLTGWLWAMTTMLGVTPNFWTHAFEIVPCMVECKSFIRKRYHVCTVACFTLPSNCYCWLSKLHTYSSNGQRPTSHRWQIDIWDGTYTWKTS